MKVIKIIAPRNNTRDVLACETLFVTLSGIRPGPLAFEILGTPHECAFLVRGDASTVDTVATQLASIYPQCDIELLQDTGEMLSPSKSIASAELRLRDALYLPIRTPAAGTSRSTSEAFQHAADPMLGLIAAMKDLKEGECCLVQYVVTAMPDNWSRFVRTAFAGQPVSHDKASPQNTLMDGLAGLGVVAVMGSLLFGVMAVKLALGIWLWLLAISLLVFGVVAIAIRMTMTASPDPVLITQKISQPAFRVRVRLIAMAETPSAAQTHLDRLCAACAGFNLPGGNGFRVDSVPIGDPLDLHAPTQQGHFRLLPLGMSLWPTRQLPILSAGELATLWHLPHGEAAMQGIAYTSSKRLLPQPGGNPADGIFIGHASKQGAVQAVHLDRERLRGNIGLVAKTQSGKSNLMAILTADVIAHDPDATVIVLDPHRSLAQRVASLVPAERASQTIYWSLADRERPFGLNLIDRMPKSGRSSAMTMASERYVDKRISDVVDAFRKIWPDNWGPRMEDYLRGPLLTMASANQLLCEGSQFILWRDRAFATFAGNKQQITLGKPDATTWQMIDIVAAEFMALTKPARPSQVNLYDKLAALFVQYVGARGAQARTPILAKLYAAICTDDAVPGRVDRNVGLAARLFKVNGLERPLQYTLLDVNAMLSSRKMREVATTALSENRYQALHDWWRDSFEKYLPNNYNFLQQMITPVEKKLNRFAMSDIARRIFGQPESTIDLPRLVQEGGVLLIDLAAGVVGKETASLVGAVILNWIAAIVFAQQELVAGRQSLVAGDGTPNQPLATSNQRPRRIFLVIDEFQSLPGADYATLLSELAKYGVQLCMGTQSLRLLDELDPELKAAWLDNVTTLFTFRAGAADAMELARELNVADEDHLSVHASDIVGLPDHACFVRVRDRHWAMTVFRVETRRADEGDAALYEQIVTHSRKTYGRDAALIDAWLQSSSAFQFESDLLDNADGPARFRRDQKVPPMPTNTANRAADVSGDGPTDYAQEVEPETDLAGELEASTDVAFVDTGEANHG